MGALFCAVCLEGYRIIPDFPYDESPEISVKSSLFLEEAILWAFATGLENPAFCSLEKKKKEIYLGATIRALFPGIIFDSFVEFGFLRPALMETFPHFKHGPVGSKILSEKMLEVPALLETKGREWRDNMEWRRKFSQLLTP
ncbi:MAG: hypothetical protein HGA67_03810 [Candidatus Yonathbacteria bacterium]|nr:hypothetical protein [Candidatus Yonathbacteria bacterium]